MSMNQPSYGADEIQVLEGLEAVRKRPGMYIGSTSAKGLHHLVWEVVDNSIDEALAGYCDHIEVTIHEDNSVTVVDNGRGIPVGEHAKMKRPALEVVMTVLHAGGKFGGGGYKVSGGLHGVGVSVVNALSEKVVVTVKVDGQVYQQEYRRGAPQYDLKVIGTTEETGTTVRFHPDPEIFTETRVFEYDILLARIRELAFLNKGIGLTLTDERTGATNSFMYEGGIIEYVSYLNQKREVLHENQFTSKVPEITFRWKLPCNTMTTTPRISIPSRTISTRMRAERTNQVSRVPLHGSSTTMLVRRV